MTAAPAGQADDLQFCRIAPGSLNVGYASRGSGPLVIFLHGFPDTHHSFIPIMERVAAAGYRAVAPEPRGYAPTGIPQDGDYRVAAFANDVVGLADALGAERFCLVGHDWGALTAYAVANLVPHRVERMVTASVPHTGHFLLNIRLRQAIRSRYMLYFQLPWLPERRLRQHDFAAIDALVDRWSPTWQRAPGTLQHVKDNYAPEGRLSAALGCYRHLAHSIASAESRRLVFSQVQVPTRMLYGLQDGCIGPALFQHQQHRFAQPLDLVGMDAGHFLHLEQVEAFTQHVLGFLPSPTP